MNGYGEIYRFEFDGTCNPFGTLLTTKCKVSILKKDYSGSVTEIPYGQATPIVIDYPTTDDDIFYPIKGSVVSFKVLGGVIGIDSISGEKEKEYLLEYYRDGNLFWRGFVSPEMCEEDIFLRYPAIEFKTIDGLGSLEGSKITDFTTKSPIIGYRDFQNIVANIYDGIGLELPYNTLVNLKGLNVPLPGATPLGSLFIYINSLYDENNTKLNPLEVLKSICYLFNSITFQDKGEWYFIKPKDLAFGYRDTFQVDPYNATTSSNTIPILEHGTDFLIIAEPKRRLKRLYKSIQLTYEQLYDGGNLDPYFSNVTAPYPTIWKPVYLQQTTTETVGGVTTTTTTYDKLSIEKFYDQTLPSFRYPTYDFYTKHGGIIAEMMYNTDSNEYGMILRGGTANTDYVQYEMVGLLDAEFTYKYNFSISSITQNMKIAIICNGFWYDTDNRSWGTTQKINTFYNSSSVNISDIQMPENNSTVQIRFYNNELLESAFFDGLAIINMAEYHGFKIKLDIPYRKKQIITSTNIKDATIIPQDIVVYNGQTVQHPSDNISYPTYDPWYYPQFVYPDISNSGYILETPSDINVQDVAPYRPLELAERNETFYYSLQELATRNILNQYSDNTNIFTGTILGKDLRFGAIYKFPNQGALADKFFFPLSMQFNEKDCTADVVLMELSTNEIDPSIVSTIYDSEDNVKYQTMISSKKKIVVG